MKQLLFAFEAAGEKTPKSGFETLGNPNEPGFCCLLMRSGIKGIMLTLRYKNKPVYVSALLPNNEPTRLLVGAPRIAVTKFLYADARKMEKVRDLDYMIIDRDERINKEIEKLWSELNIGVAVDEIPFKHSDFYFFMPMGMKKHMFTLNEFVVLTLDAKLKSLIDFDRNIQLKIANLKKKFKDSNLKDEKLTKNLKELEELLPTNNYIELRTKINYFKSKLKKEQRRKGIGGTTNSSR